DTWVAWRVRAVAIVLGHGPDPCRPPRKPGSSQARSGRWAADLPELRRSLFRRCRKKTLTGDRLISDVST
ncbi:MAG: hypothetical protein WA731_00740, partial [Pseudonocardiaceae bacterium]